VAELDAAQLEAQHAAARANVATLDAQVAQAALDAAYADKNAKASIAAADAAVASAQARLAGARAVVANARSSYERARDLFGSGAISRQDLDQAEMTLHTSDAEATAADKEVARAVANLALARASADVVGLKQQQLLALQENRRSAESRLAEAEANLGERSIVAPSDGTVISRLVEVGDVVGPGTPIFQLIDLRRLYVKVYIPEPDIAKLRLGDRADVFVDAFPGRGFVGRVSRIYDQAEFTPKNVETAEERLKLVFGVEVSLDNPDSVLKPGMPADCVIHWTSIPPDAGHGS
jgi:HlyD family secretion protein